jgi:hypothetical protein
MMKPGPDEPTMRANYTMAQKCEAKIFWPSGADFLMKVDRMTVIADTQTEQPVRMILEGYLFEHDGKDQVLRKGVALTHLVIRDPETGDRYRLNRISS